jgi:hypothetical protein
MASNPNLPFKISNDHARRRECRALHRLLSRRGRSVTAIQLYRIRVHVDGLHHARAKPAPRTPYATACGRNGDYFSCRKRKRSPIASEGKKLQFSERTSRSNTGLLGHYFYRSGRASLDSARLRVDHRSRSCPMSELKAHIGASQRFMPGIALQQKRNISHCQGMMIADWIAVDSDGKERMTGTGSIMF